MNSAMARIPLAAVVVMALAAAGLGKTDLWVESAGEMILADRPAGSAKQIEKSGCRNEFVAAQLGLRADGPSGEALSFEWSALAGPGGEEISRDHIHLYRAADIEVGHGQKVDSAKDKARARAPGNYPDALVPLVARDGTNVANAITPEANKTISFWVDIFIPAGRPAGAYAGKIALKSGGKEIEAISVRVKVLDAQIPADSTIPSLFNLRMHPHVLANLDTYVAEVLRHRVQPTHYHFLDNITRPSYGWGVLDKYNPGGKGYVNVYVADTSLNDRSRQELLGLIKEATGHLKARQLFDRAYMYMKDEPDAKEAQGIVDVAETILKEFPEWKGKLLCTTSPKANDLDKVLTTYACALKCYGAWTAQPPRDYPGRPEWDKRRADGQRLWFYVSNAQGWPYPTFDVHTVNMGWEPRVFGWAFWYEKAEGHLYWDLMFMPQWTLHAKFPPGDGELIYPGDFTMPGAPSWALVKDLRGPVASRRLKMLRQGLQEWELLKMAEQKAGREKTQAVVEKVYRHMGQRTWAPEAYDPARPMWSYDEQAWDKARTEVIDLLKPQAGSAR